MEWGLNVLFIIRYFLGVTFLKMWLELIWELGCIRKISGGVGGEWKGMVWFIED